MPSMPHSIGKMKASRPAWIVRSSMLGSLHDAPRASRLTSSRNGLVSAKNNRDKKWCSLLASLLFNASHCDKQLVAVALYRARRGEESSQRPACQLRCSPTRERATLHPELVGKRCTVGRGQCMARATLAPSEKAIPHDEEDTEPALMRPARCMADRLVNRRDTDRIASIVACWIQGKFLVAAQSLLLLPRQVFSNRRIIPIHFHWKFLQLFFYLEGVCSNSFWRWLNYF